MVCLIPMRIGCIFENLCSKLLSMSLTSCVINEYFNIYIWRTYSILVSSVLDTTIPELTEQMVSRKIFSRDYYKK